MLEGSQRRWIGAGLCLMIAMGAVLWWWASEPRTTSLHIAVHSTPSVQPTRRELSIESVPTGASLHIQGIYVGHTPARSFPVQLKTDEALVLELKREGFADFEQKIVWPQGQRRIELRVVLERAP